MMNRLASARANRKLSDLSETRRQLLQFIAANEARRRDARLAVRHSPSGTRP